MGKVSLSSLLTPQLGLQGAKIENLIRQATEAIRKRGQGVALTGAGISSESGISTYRDPGALYDQYDAGTQGGMLRVLANNPDKAPEILEAFFTRLEKAEPNQGHVGLAVLEKMGLLKSVITQNVDGLHHQAGSRDVVELHGNIRRNKCIQCDKRYDSLEGTKEGTPPECSCGGKIRPDVVWFGEMLPQDAIRHAFDVSERCDLFFSVGTAAVVHPAASLPLIAKRSGAFVVEVNVEPTEISHLVDEILLGKSGEILPYLVKSLK